MANPVSVWVYREGRRRRHGATIVRELSELVDLVRGLPASPRRASAAVDALVACGQLEAALADVGHPSAAAVAPETERLAAAALGHSYDARACAARLQRVPIPRTLVVSTQEGCAFYALHPSSYARATRALPSCEQVLVVGIRTIGATLSAMVVAALRARGAVAARCTVRPVGHPFDRVLELDAEIARAVDRARTVDALVVVVDEGPGLSGSTFLAVAERLARAGILDHRIVLLASSHVDTTKLVAPNAEIRFRRFRLIVAPVEEDLPANGIALSGGAWRTHVFEDESFWPSVFVQAERRKVLVDDGTRLLKFEGLGTSGRAAARRAEALCAEGFIVPGRDAGGGYRSYPWEGTPCTSDDVDETTLERLASYCARRPIVCPPSGAGEDLVPMVGKNLELLGFTNDVRPTLSVVRAAVVDGRMAPHEWLRRVTGPPLLKSDAIAHGDDHFFPGPTDIAWDIAGAIVEWQLGIEARDRLVDRYVRESGDDVRPRLDDWIVAYSAFRGALMMLAHDCSTCDRERGRLVRDLERYRTVLIRNRSARCGGE